MSEVKDLRLIIHYEDDHMWAEVEDYPGCFATGRDMAELNEALEEAISIYLAPTAEDRRRVVLEILPEQPKGEARRMPARIELAAA